MNHLVEQLGSLSKRRDELLFLRERERDNAVRSIVGFELQANREALSAVRRTHLAAVAQGTLKNFAGPSGGLKGRELATARIR